MDDKLKNVCGEPWDGIVMKKTMQWLTPRESLQVEKHEMVALPTNRNDGTGSWKSHKMEA